MRIKNSQILIGGLVFVLLLSLYSLALELYLSFSDKQYEIGQEITSLELYSQKALITISESEDETFSYSLHRSKNAEEKVYGSTLRLDIPTGVLEIKVPRERKLENVSIKVEESPVSIFQLEAENLYIHTEGDVDLHSSTITNLKLEASEVLLSDILATNIDIEAEGRLELAGVTSFSMDLSFKEDSYVLSSSTASLKAFSEEADLEVELLNGISSASVTGKLSTIFINGEDSYESQLEMKNEGGARIIFETGGGILYII